MKHINKNFWKQISFITLGFSILILINSNQSLIPAKAKVEPNQYLNTPDKCKAVGGTWTGNACTMNATGECKDEVGGEAPTPIAGDGGGGGGGGAPTPIAGVGGTPNPVQPCSSSTPEGDSCECIGYSGGECMGSNGSVITTTRPGASPILLTLDNSLPQLTKSTYFDLNDLRANNIFSGLSAYFGQTAKTKITWPVFNKSIGWLALDLNKNGIIDNGTELFGESTAGKNFEHGYQALASLKDKNQEGIVSGIELSNLLFWSDLNHDGISQKSELKQISDLGVVSINIKNNLIYEQKSQEGGFIYPYSKNGVKIKNNEKVATASSFDVWLMETH